MLHLVYDGEASLALAESIIWPLLCAISASYKVLSECLMNTYCEIHPQGGGIWRLVRRGTRQLGISFYGVGYPHPAIERLIVQINKMIMHYRNQSCLGPQMRNTTEWLVIELGRETHPSCPDITNV